MTYEPMQPACAPGTVPSAGVWPSAEDGLAGWEQLQFTKKNKVLDLPRPQAPLFDTHAHLRSFWGEDKDPVAVLVRAYRAGVRGLVTLFDPVSDMCEETRDATDFSAWLQDRGVARGAAGAVVGCGIWWACTPMARRTTRMPYMRRSRRRWTTRGARAWARLAWTITSTRMTTSRRLLMSCKWM